MKKYKEAPWWWYIILLVLSFFSGLYMWLRFLEYLTRILFYVGLIVVFKGQTTLPWWSYIVALILGAFVTVGLFYELICIWILSSALYSLSPPFWSLAWAMESPPIS